MARPPIPFCQKVFILDFDNTITTQDTISILLSISLSYQKSLGKDLSKLHSEILQKYNTDFTSHVETYRPKKEERTSITQEIEYQRSLRELEDRSFQRVSESGIFQGIGGLEWRRLGRKAFRNGDVKVRNGFERLSAIFAGFSGAQPEPRSGIISVNFSGEFIRGVIFAASEGKTDRMEMITNQCNENGFIEGPNLEDTLHEGWSQRGKSVLSASDMKLDAMKKMLGFWREGGDPLMAIYVGDSETDIECLMDEGVVGVVMAENGDGTLMDMLKRIGVEVFHVSEFKDRQGKVVYWSRDFVDIIDSPILKESK